MQRYSLVIIFTTLQRYVMVVPKVAQRRIVKMSEYS